jgi:hypothetical protein
MRVNIMKSDFAIFDLSDWNPNVALELGLSQSLRKKPSKPYYIVLNTNRSDDVPADIRGIQRLEYTSYDYRRVAGLGDQLITYILSKEYWIKKIWSAIPEAGNELKQRLMAVKVLAHMRENAQLTNDNLKSIARGTRLRDDDRQEVVDVLLKLKLIRKIRGSSAYTQRRRLYA